MILRFVLLSFCLTAVFPLKADRVKRGLKALEKEKYEKAGGLFHKALEKDSINAGAHYGLSLLHVTEGYEAYNIDTAYVHILWSIDHYESLDSLGKAIKKLKKRGIVDTVLHNQKQVVEALAFEHVSSTHTIEAYNYFIQYYATAMHVEEAVSIRNELAFEKARRINTYDAYKDFLDTYPDAAQIEEASELYEFLLYEKKTKSRKLERYVDFLKEYPNTNYTLDALENIFELYTIDNQRESYLRFIEAYPNNPYAKKAVNYLYHLTKHREGITFFEQQYDKLISDSLRTIIDIDKGPLFPLYQQGLYGFANLSGKLVIPPTYTAINEDYLCGEIPDDYLLVTNQARREIVNHRGDLIFEYDNELIAPLGDGLLLSGKMGKYGALHVAGYVVADVVYDTLEVLDRQYIKYTDKGKSGLLSYTGRLITGAVYDDIFMADNFVIFERHGKLGIANDQQLFQLANQEIAQIATPYDDYYLLGNNMILAIAGKEQVVLNHQLGIVVPKLEWEIYQLQEGWLMKQEGSYRFFSHDLVPFSQATFEGALYRGSWLALSQEGKWALLDQRENTFPEFVYDSVNLVANTFAIGRREDAAYLISQNMESVKLAQAATVQILRTGMRTDSVVEYAVVRNPGNFKMLYDSYGKQLVSGQYNDISMIGPYFVLDRDGKKGLADSTGKTLLQISYDGIGNYDNGFLATLRNKKFGLFNSVKGIDIKPQYDIGLRSYNDSLFIASKNGRLGVIDKNDTEILPFKYSEVTLWNDSLALVKVDSQWAVYNILAKEAVLEGISSLKYVSDDTNKQAIISKDAQYGVISNRNLELLPPTYDDILNLGKSEQPIYFAEKRVKEADLFVVIYYNGDGEVIHKQTFSEEDYDHIYCY